MLMLQQLESTEPLTMYRQLLVACSDREFVQYMPAVGHHEGVWKVGATKKGGQPFLKMSVMMSVILLRELTYVKDFFEIDSIHSTFIKFCSLWKSDEQRRLSHKKKKRYE